ncbi:hypothetical protein HRI_004088000 [Hibiscus trionum]|uniref:Endonuclease/exonuclease/phosphatase domain-containing protein n=1 Tax=Hibiscus trionum TaxID=183268 RepID=A0A9W7IX43_HIBTR|nr:hypothetical protein HRI_004088000 [Hibiscus trionum]
MKTLSWNVRGLGKLWAVQRLRNKLRDVRPDIVFLLETKLSSSRMVEARRRCGFPCGFDVSSVGSCGGLSLAWRSNIPVSIISWSIFHIDAMVKENETSCEWRLTGFYGNPVERLREESWDLLRNLSVDQSHPWLVIGDFNEILLSSEKRGGRIRSARSMEAFRRALGDCDLEDLGFSVNMQDDGNALGADRAFKFSAEWTMEEDCESLIKQFWEETNLPLSQKLVELGVKLSAWSRGRKGDCRKRTRELNDKLKALTDRDPDDDTLAEILDVKLALNVEADKDELYWEQRARVNWLRHGDRNSSFFHKWASVRKKKNTISKLQNDDGVWFSEDTEMLNLVGSYFQKLFTSSDMVDDRRLLDCVRPVITGEGIGWIIGDGKSVNIWNDSWVPGLSDGRITVDSISTQFTTVFDLIKEQGLWKEDVIRRLFNTTQAAQILKIPLANVPTPDVYTWRHDNSEGRFCVTPRIWVEEAPMAVEAAADEDRRRLRLPS